MPEGPFEQRRFRQAEARFRHEARMAETMARIAEAQRRALGRVEEQMGRLAERLRRHGVRLGPGPPLPRRKPGRHREDGGVPVAPDRPRNLSGGAAAELEFDRD